MALWQNAKTRETWNDKLTAIPGDDDFSVDLVKAHWPDDGFNYMGTPNWEPDPTEEDDGVVH